MKNIVYLLMLCAFIGVGQEFKKRKEQEKLSAIVVRSLAAGPEGLAKVGVPQNCLGKKYCVTVYVAPWCGVCKSNEPTFLGLNDYIHENRSDIGFGLVIGAAKPAENLQMKQELAKIESYTDDSGALMKLRNIKVFPTWIITDPSGKEVNRISGGVQVSNFGQYPEVVKKIIGR